MRLAAQARHHSSDEDGAPSPDDSTLDHAPASPPTTPISPIAQHRTHLVREHEQGHRGDRGDDERLLHAYPTRTVDAAASSS